MICVIVHYELLDDSCGAGQRAGVERDDRGAA